MENMKTVKKFKSFNTLENILNVIYFSVSSIFSNINANQNKALSCRVSKSCNHANDCANYLRICLNFGLKTKAGKTDTNFVYLTQFDYFF